jgi:ribosomal protein L14
MDYQSSTRTVGSSRPRATLGADTTALQATLASVALQATLASVKAKLAAAPNGPDAAGYRIAITQLQNQITAANTPTVAYVQDIATAAPVSTVAVAASTASPVGMIEITSVPPIELIATPVVTDIGHHDFWQAYLGGKRYRFADTTTRLQKDGVPVNELEDSWIGLHIRTQAFSGIVSIYFKYLLTKWNVQYADTAQKYLISLQNEYDPIKFLMLLLNYKAFGISLDSSKIDLLSYENTPYHAEGINLGQGSVVYFDKYNPTKGDTKYLSTVQKSLLSMGGFICEDGAYDLDWTTINARRYANYSGYNAAQSAIILTEVVRFGERCLALAVKETQVLITSSMYTDLPTLTTLYQYFVHNYASIMLKIEGMTATCRVGDNTGALIKEVKTTFNDKWATVGQCITMPLKDGSGRSVKMTIKQALIAQAEAAFWMIKWNMNKLTGRIAQLEDPTAVLLPEDTTVPFQFDPWKNPFLLLDIKESKDDATAYRNVASSTAPQYEDPTYTRRDSAGNIVVQ